MTGPGRVRGRVHPRRRRVRSRRVSAEAGVSRRRRSSLTGGSTRSTSPAGVALIGMAAYHLTWDLADFQLVSPLLPFTPPMRLLSHTVASTFLALAGLSLALAHRDRLNLHGLRQAPRDRRRRSRAGDGRKLGVRPGNDDLVRHPALHRRGEPPRAAADRGARPGRASPPAPRRSPCRSSSSRRRSTRRRCSGSASARRCRTRSTGARFCPWAGVTLLGLGAARLPGRPPMADEAGTLARGRGAGAGGSPSPDGIASRSISSTSRS